MYITGNKYQDSAYHSILVEYGIDQADQFRLQSMWCEPWRVYHGMNHLRDLLNQISRDSNISRDDYKLYVAAAVIHDCVYMPGANDNEDESIEFYVECCKKTGVTPSKDLIDIVEATKYKDIPYDNNRIIQFLKYDLGALCTRDIAKMIHNEELIFKEFQAVDYKLYREGRTNIMKNLSTIVKRISPDSLIDEYIEYIHEKKRTIAVFPGSFNPLHRGHIDIIKKAEKMFDKVIVAPGINPSKPNQDREAILLEVKKRVLNEVREFSGTLTALVSEMQDEYTNVVVVKGMGRHVDFEDHKMQQRYVEDMNPDIKFAYIIPSREVEYYSSSAVRVLKQYDQEENYLAPKIFE